MEISVPDDGDEEHEVEEDDGGSGGTVAANPDPLHTPGPVIIITIIMIMIMMITHHPLRGQLSSLQIHIATSAKGSMEVRDRS